MLVTNRFHQPFQAFSVLVVTLGIILSYRHFATPRFLTFSDSAKFSQAAKYFSQGKGLAITHSFYDSKLLASFTPGSVFPAGFLPVPSLILSIPFKLFGASDQTVFATGALFFVLSGLLIFHITKKLHSQISAVAATIFFSLNLYNLEYAVNASSEIFFIFEILLFVYLIISGKKFRLLSILVLVLMLFTRQQSIIFVFAVVTSGVVLLLKTARKERLKALLIVTPILLVTITLLSQIKILGFKPFRYYGLLQMASGVNQGIYLRGGSAEIPITGLASKFFYNVYNFAKSPERIISPALLILSLVAFLTLKPDSPGRLFTIFSFLLLLLFVMGASLTLPNARYVHPAATLLYIPASIALGEFARRRSFTSKLVVCLLVVFVTLPSLGHIFIDSKFRATQYNREKPPASYVISQVFSHYIPPGQLVLTNLDAWAAWYNNLTTMWFPVSPRLIAELPSRGKIKYIAITTYKQDDQDFALGEWADIFNKENFNDQYLESNYNQLTSFTINQKDIYENLEIQGVILTAK